MTALQIATANCAALVHDGLGEKLTVAVLDAGGQAALDEIAGVLFGSTQELARLAAVVGGILAGAYQGGPEPAGAGAGADADGAMDVEAAADSAQPQ